MPETSVVMTVYNGEAFLQESIDSVLAQTYSNWELIVVDDGSTDATAEILASFTDPRIRVIRQENSGLGVAANRGIRKARGQWVARIDDDDVWEREKLERQIAFLKKHPEYVLLGSSASVINHRGEELYAMNMPQSDQKIRQILLQYNPFMHSSVLFDKDLFSKIGGYYEPMNKYFIDYLLFYQLSEVGKVANLPEKLLRYRISTTSIGHSFGAEPQAVTDLIRQGVRQKGLKTEDRQKLQDLKKQQFLSLRQRQAEYYFFSGRALLFYKQNRKAAIRDLTRSLKYNFFKLKSWAYLVIAIFAPGFLITTLQENFLSSHIKNRH